MKKRGLVLLTSAALAAGLTVMPAGAVSYNDTQGHWAESSITRWSDYGVVQGGDNGFAPNTALTRGQYAVILSNLLGLTELAPNSYADLRGDEWYAEAILKCAAAGILQGDGINSGATRTMTRQEAAVMTARALAIAPEANPDLSKFPDGDQVADWAAGYVGAMVRAGIVNGTGAGTVAPGMGMDRASAMALLDQAVVIYANQKGDSVEVPAATSGIVLVAAKDVAVTGQIEDLVIAPGAADGAITLRDTAVTGTITVHAAKARVALDGSSRAAAVLVREEADGASITVGAQASVKVLTAAAPETELKVEGTVDSLDVADSAAKTTLTVEKGASISNLETAADQVSVSGAGTVENLTVSGGSGTTVSKDTTVSKVENNSGSSVTVGDQEIAPGETGSNSGDSSGGSGGGSVTPGPSYTPVEVAPAPLADHRTEGKEDVLYSSYTAEAKKSSANDYVDVTIRAADLVNHQNGEQAMGYWAGFAVKAPEGAVQMKVAFGTDRDGLTLGEAGPLENNVTGEGKPGVAFYADAGSAAPKLWAQVQWLNAEGEELDLVTYKLDLSGVTRKAAVGDSAELTQALSDPKVSVIQISGTIGSAADYGLYTVERPVTIQGGTVYGSFVLKESASGSAFDAVTIFNQGDNGGGEHRNAINAYVSELTVRNSVLNAGGSAFANGLMILPSASTVRFTIEGNRFVGYQNGVDGWSTTGILITSNYPMESKAFFEAEASHSAMLETLDDYTIITGNTFENCKNDYTRNQMGDRTTIQCTANSATDNFRLSSGEEGSRFYVTGSVTRNSDTEILDGATLTVVSDAVLTVKAGVSLTVSGTLEGEVRGADDTAKLVIAEGGRYQELESGTYTWNGSGWMKQAE